jgi:hypothetical protein
MTLYTKKSELLSNYLVLPAWENPEDFSLIDLNANKPIYEGTCFECWTYLAKIQPKCRWLQKYVK